MTLDDWEKIAGIVSDGITALAVLVGGVWAVVHFRRRRDLSPKVDLSVKVEFLGRQVPGGDLLIQVVVELTNCGAVRHVVKDLGYSLRTLKVSDALAPGGESLLDQINFPNSHVSKRRLFPKHWVHSFVDPGVTNSYRSVTTLPNDTAFVLASTRFTYENEADDFHDARCVFAVPAELRATTAAPAVSLSPAAT